MKNTSLVMLFLGALTAVVVRGGVIPAAPEAGDAEVIPAWRTLTDEAAARRAIAPGIAGGPVALSAPGVVTFPAEFTEDPAKPRAYWDVALPCDLRLRSGIQFDFYCEDLSPFGSFSCYFKSGKGWYHGSFSPEASGQWQRVTVTKASCGVEESPEGWGRISAIRISGMRAGAGKTRCAIANVALLGGSPDAVIVYADSLAAKGGAEAKGYLDFASNVSESLKAIGVENAIVADTDLNADTLTGVSAVVLPYNPHLPKEKMPHLKAFSARGGRILACYSQSAAVYDLLGVKVKGYKRPSDDGSPSLAGFLKRGAGLGGQPAFAPQASWMTQVIARDPGVEVVAEWADGKRNPLGLPALVRTKTGLFMGHVWLGGTDEEKADLMRAMACDLNPGLAQKIAERTAAAERKAAEMKAWLAGRPSKAGERRAFWCHSAWGLGGGREWEASVGFLKENGFNELLVNLCWAGTAFYASEVLPVAAEVATKGDAFAQCRAACRKHGVKMHVWKVCWNMGACATKAFEREMVAAGRVQVSPNGKPLARWLCPSHPENQKLEIEAMMELARRGADGVHFDYIRYPGDHSCFCKGCRARFEAAVGHAVTNWPGAVRGRNAPLKDRWNAFRAENITKVVRTVSERVRRECPGVRISAAVFTSPLTDPFTVAQDWPAWCREGLLDFVCPMDYIESTAMFHSRVKAQRDVVGKATLLPGIGLSCWTNDGRSPERLAKQIEAVRALGLEGYTVFNFDRNAERALPLLRLGVTRQD